MGQAGRPSGGIFRHVKARPRLFTATFIGILCFVLLPAGLTNSTRLLISWNVATLFFLAMMTLLMIRSDGSDMRRRAQQTDEGRFAVLFLSMVAALASLLAIVVELSHIRNAQGLEAAPYIGLSVLTIFASWSFIQMIFTEHYAHEFYMAPEGETEVQQGLAFPGEHKPDYVDFLYFTVTIGVANQTADISIVSRQMRILVLVHAIISYFFNAAILALSINIVSSIL